MVDSNYPSFTRLKTGVRVCQIVFYAILGKRELGGGGRM
jgi:hypothetical protein